MLNRILLGVLAATLLLIAAELFGLGASQTPSYEDCRRTEYAKASTNEAKEAQKGLSRTFVKCIGFSLDQNNGFITSVATIFLAVITFGLVYLGVDQGDTNKRQSRAYIGIDNGDARQVEDRALMWVHIKNKGGTPAYKVSKRINCKILPTDATQFPLPAPDDKNWVIVPEAFWTARAYLPLHNVQILEWGKGELSAFFWGRIDYEDVFRRPQWMTFRYRIGLVHKRDAAGLAIHWELDPCEEGNDASR